MGTRHRSLTARAWLPTFAAAALVLPACDRAAPTASAPAASASTAGPASAPASVPAIPETDPILPESRSWSRETCLEKLAALAASTYVDAGADASEPTRPAEDLSLASSRRVRREFPVDWAAVSAAVRLVRLSESEPLCAPSGMTPRDARRLRVCRVAESRWALGRDAATAADMVLSSPVLIDESGALQVPLEGMEEELAALYISRDADVFPHLVISPVRVLIVGADVVPAIVANELPRIRFTLERKGDYPYVALMLARPVAAPAASSQVSRVASRAVSASTEPVEGSAPSVPPPDAPPDGPLEVARYTWDPYESAFQGPASELLPDPPGGKFELDLSASKALIPVGGRIAEPKPHQQDVEPAEKEPPPF